MRIKFLHFIAVFCIAVISYTTTHCSFMKFSYEINKLEIAQKFCVNKEKTNFECEGLCYLKSQFENAENPLQKGDEKLIEENTLLLFSVNFKTLSLNPHKKEKSYPFLRSANYSFLFTNKIFQPPKFGRFNPKKMV